MPIRLTNSLTRSKDVFEPQNPNRVTMYVCGPTVYSYAHIGNARPAVVFDLLYRVLKLEYPEVVYARNITDIDDKINKAAKESGVDYLELTEKFARIYREDMAALGVQPPVLEPKVTDNIPQIIEQIQALIDAGHAYEGEGHVLFNVPSYEDYGHLSGRDRREMIAGARVEVAPYKKDPADFVLWKPSDDDTPGWDSPWGRGRPGWHIECSAMVAAHLGQTIDIHGGGHDLQFPHHENEIAQATCAHGGITYCRYWLHNGFVNVDQQKMSKSVGNVLLVHKLLEHIPGEVIRTVLLSSHYRQPVDWTDEAISQARAVLDRLYGALRNLSDVNVDAISSEQIPAGVLEALRDDLNTPEAFAQLFAIAKTANSSDDADIKARCKRELLAAGQLMGLLETDPEVWFEGESAEDSDEIEQLIADREQARTNKDWAKADRIRDQLQDMGIEIEDSADGTRWRRAG